MRRLNFQARLFYVSSSNSFLVRLGRNTFGWLEREEEILARLKKYIIMHWHILVLEATRPWEKLLYMWNFYKHEVFLSVEGSAFWQRCVVIKSPWACKWVKTKSLCPTVFVRDAVMRGKQRCPYIQDVCVSSHPCSCPVSLACQFTTLSLFPSL